MKVWKLDTMKRLVAVPGPADLAGYTGTLTIEGTATDSEAARWAVGLGLFVARGGTLRRVG